jgi:UDP-N-acetylglucosamine:LPS N-acetylglucosamine transferase
MEFIGPLSHLKAEKRAGSGYKYQLMVICSGPEPARTNLEQLMLRELSSVNIKSVLVRGTQKKFTGKSPGHIHVLDMCNSEEMSALMSDSEIILSRSGYSTIMDLVQAGKNAILIPTPGQTEQEYLADYHHKEKRFFSMPEKNFSLKIALQQSRAFRNDFKTNDKDMLHHKVDELLHLIREAHCL